MSLQFKKGQLVVFKGGDCMAAKKGATAIVVEPTLLSAFHGQYLIEVWWIRNGLDGGQSNGGYIASRFSAPKEIKLERIEL